MVKVNDLNGMEVITADAFTVGKVSGAEVDTKTWRLTHMHVTLTDEATKDLGFKKPFLGHLTVCLPVNLIKAFGDVITVYKNMQELREIPECKRK